MECVCRRWRRLALEMPCTARVDTCQLGLATAPEGEEQLCKQLWPVTLGCRTLRELRLESISSELLGRTRGHLEHLVHFAGDAFPR